MGRASHPSSARLWLCHMPSLSLSLPTWKAGGRYLGQEIFKSAHTHTHTHTHTRNTESLAHSKPQETLAIITIIITGLHKARVSVPNDLCDQLLHNTDEESEARRGEVSCLQHPAQGSTRLVHSPTAA